MKLAFSTNAYLKFSFQEAVRRLAGIGYRGVEIMADVPHAWPACLLDEHKRAIREALTLARELGAPCITTEPGGPVEPGASWSAALRLFVEMIKPVAEHAEKEGVLLLVEPEPGLLIEKADQFLEFMQHIDSPAVGLNFDIGHSYCVGDNP